MTATDADALAAAHAITPEPEPMKEELPNSEAYCAANSHMRQVDPPKSVSTEPAKPLRRCHSKQNPSGSPSHPEDCPAKDVPPKVPPSHSKDAPAKDVPPQSFAKPL